MILNPMQAAYWSARQLDSSQGGGAHLYAEFDCSDVDVDRLRNALAVMANKHQALSLAVDTSGRQYINAERGLSLELDDWRGLGAEQVEKHLALKRHTWTHQTLDIKNGVSCRISLDLLPHRANRLHVCTDMMAIDPASFCLLMDGLARAYAGCETPGPGASFFDYLSACEEEDNHTSLQQQDRQWWQSQFENIAPAPDIPNAPPSVEGGSNTRLHDHLSLDQRHALKLLAKEAGTSLSTLLLAAFSLSLSQHVQQRRFRINVPVFWRRPVVPDVQHIIGEFANILIVSINVDNTEKLAALCKAIDQQKVQQLSHLRYHGVLAMRDFSRRQGRPEWSPVVFTSGVDMPAGTLFSDAVTRVFGKMIWAVSQGPGVALDAQLADVDDGMIVNWDVRQDVVPIEWVQTLFSSFMKLLRTLCSSDVNSDVLIGSLMLATTKGSKPKAEASSNGERELSPLQKAYLQGRYQPHGLGGVAMQEFREYRGRCDFSLLSKRLADCVAHQPWLRSYIDERELRLCQLDAENAPLNIDYVDLSELSIQEAEQHLQAVKESYTHALFDLAVPPWNITVYRLAGAERQDQVVIHARFDALIADGRTIASLMCELFDQHVTPAKSDAHTPSARVDPQARAEDEKYWRHALAAVHGAANVAWKRPPAECGSSRYRRQSVSLAADALDSLNRRAAQGKLFLNSLLMGICCSALERWAPDELLCIGVPVAPQLAASGNNHSSFIAVNWTPDQLLLSQRLSRLQRDILEGMSHLAFAGVDLARLLFQQHGEMPVLPIVITNCLSWPTLGAESELRWVDGVTQTPQVAMDIRLVKGEHGELVIAVDYAELAVEDDTIADLLKVIATLLSRVAAGEDIDSLDSESLLSLPHYCGNSSEEQASQLGWLSHIRDHVFNLDNHDIAVIQGNQRVTYAELGQHIRTVMAVFEKHALSAGDVVAICLPRGIDHLAVTVACALSGIVWVPLDVESPQARLDYMLDCCVPDLVIAQPPLVTRFPVIAPEQFCHAGSSTIERDLSALSASTQRSLYLFTSGTTGKPKCVVLCNRAIANVLGHTLSRWQITPQDVFISVTPLHHDMSLFDTLGCLTAGATLVMPLAEQAKDALAWNRLVKLHGVTLWCSVPPIVDMLVACQQSDNLASLRLVAQGGDYVKPAVIAQLRSLNPNVCLYSLGGPTETSIWSIWHAIESQDAAIVPYGTPLPGNRYFVVDNKGRHCPAGVPGRIYTSGVNLALGYLVDGELSQQDFVTISDESGDPVRAYRSGDCGRYQRNGVLLFHHRVDGYIKIRGVRVSLSDINNELMTHPAIRQGVAVALGNEREEGLSIHVLYVPQRDSAITLKAMREYLAQRLPASHLPTHIMAIQAIPLTPNGKIDTRRIAALFASPPAVESSQTATSCQDSAASTDIEQKILNVLVEVVGEPIEKHELSARTTFIQLGIRPHHLVALSERFKTELGMTLSAIQIAQCRTISELLTRAG